VDANGESQGTFVLVVDASGSGSQLSRRALHPARARALTYGALWGSFDWPAAKFAANTLEQRYVGAHTMIGVLPIGRHAAIERDQVAFFWSIKSRAYDAWLERGLAHWKREVLAIWPETQIILDQVETAADMTLARYGHRTLRTPYGNRIAILGDAAHSTSPQLGQGANRAWLDAWSLAEALRGTEDIGIALQNYAASRRWHVRAFQLSSRLLTPFYQSDSRVLAALRDLLFDPVAKLPLARRIVAGLISGMLASPPKRLQI
ncbi:MAG: FAD-dependent monooxygenase, partial [Candidatus Devosia euplotis]|nr:FAD-dependent monooxygenase [Candidatus Devosia euplotis]